MGDDAEALAQFLPGAPHAHKASARTRLITYGDGKQSRIGARVRTNEEIVLLDNALDEKGNPTTSGTIKQSGVTNKISKPHLRRMRVPVEYSVSDGKAASARDRSRARSKSPGRSTAKNMKNNNDSKPTKNNDHKNGSRVGGHADEDKEDKKQAEAERKMRQMERVQQQQQEQLERTQRRESRKNRKDGRGPDAPQRHMAPGVFNRGRVRTMQEKVAKVQPRSDTVRLAAAKDKERAALVAQEDNGFGQGTSTMRMHEIGLQGQNAGPEKHIFVETLPPQQIFQGTGDDAVLIGERYADASRAATSHHHGTMTTAGRAPAGHAPRVRQNKHGAVVRTQQGKKLLFGSNQDTSELDRMGQATASTGNGGAITRPKVFAFEQREMMRKHEKQEKMQRRRDRQQPAKRVPKAAKPK